MHQNTVFIVPSVIHCSTNPLSYSQVRSVFSPEERAAQTVRTLQSIRLKVPHAQVVFVEAGLQHAPDDIKALADRYVYVGKWRSVRTAVDGPHKGLGEAVSLILANRAIQSLRPTYCLKLSGRYYLNNQFRMEDWENPCLTARRGGGWISTTLYGFPYDQYSKWRGALKAAVPFLQQGEAIENTMWRLLPDVQPIDCLGVSGIIAPWNQEVSL